MTLNIDLEDVPDAILEAVKARIMANRRRLLDRQELLRQPPLQPKPQSRKFGADSKTWKRPEPAAVANYAPDTLTFYGYFKIERDPAARFRPASLTLRSGILATQSTTEYYADIIDGNYENQSATIEFPEVNTGTEPWDLNNCPEYAAAWGEIQSNFKGSYIGTNPGVIEGIYNRQETGWYYFNSPFTAFQNRYNYFENVPEAGGTFQATRVIFLEIWYTDPNPRRFDQLRYFTSYQNVDGSPMPPGTFAFVAGSRDIYASDAGNFTGNVRYVDLGGWEEIAPGVWDPRTSTTSDLIPATGSWAAQYNVAQAVGAWRIAESRRIPALQSVTAISTGGLNVDAVFDLEEPDYSSWPGAIAPPYNMVQLLPGSSE